MKLVITIELGNEEMRTPYDCLGAIVRGFQTLSLTEPVSQGQSELPLTRPLRDINGNRVGSFAFTKGD